MVRWSEGEGDQAKAVESEEVEAVAAAGAAMVNGELKEVDCHARYWLLP